jgi:uncharacterized membrane protein
VHSVGIFNPRWRDERVARLGLMPWKAVYSAVSLAGLVMIVVGYGIARQNPVVLYAPPVWTRHLALLLMVPVFPLLIATYLPGRIQRAARHPMLVAVKLWALSHLVANGTLADVLLFGSFLAWAVADRIAVKRRGVPWKRMVPDVAPSPGNDIIALVAGLGLYVAFLYGLHRVLIGVSPI